MPRVSGVVLLAACLTLISNAAGGGVPRPVVTGAAVVLPLATLALVWSLRLDGEQLDRLERVGTWILVPATLVLLISFVVERDWVMTGLALAVLTALLSQARRSRRAPDEVQRSSGPRDERPEATT